MSADIEQNYQFLKCLKGKNIGFYGGSFDPPHFGHLEMIKIASRKFDVLLVVPTAINPLKTIKKILNDEVRLKLLQFLTKDLKNVMILDFEINSSTTTPNYTITTLEFLQNFSPKSMTLILGEDCILNFDKWKDYKKIISMCKIMVFTRPYVDLCKAEIEKILDFKNTKNEVYVQCTACKNHLRKLGIKDYEIINFTSPISSTAIKSHLNDQQFLDILIPKEVASEEFSNFTSDIISQNNQRVSDGNKKTSD